MGCSNNKIDKIENRMMDLKLRKKKIQLERENKLKQLKKMIGKEIIRDSIDDYEESEEDSFYNNNEQKLYKKNVNSLNEIIHFKEKNVKSFFDNKNNNFDINNNNKYIYKDNNINNNNSNKDNYKDIYNNDNYINDNNIKNNYIYKNNNYNNHNNYFNRLYN